jgi:hypothetical protein
VQSFLNSSFTTGQERTQEGSSFIFSWSPFFKLGLELVDKEIKRASLLIIMWSPYFTLG